MRLIRFFLWSLVLTFVLQGWIHADDYGSSVGFLGGIAFTMSIWQESTLERLRTVIGSGTTYVGLPRSLVLSVLRETARHPSVHTVPTLRRILEGYERVWLAFREQEIAWTVEHTDLVGALHTDPVARPLWTLWDERVAELEAAIGAAAAQRCLWPWPITAACQAAADHHTVLTQRWAIAQRAQRAWRHVLDLRGPVETADWWSTTQLEGAAPPPIIANWSTQLAYLHNVSSPQDPRVIALRSDSSVIAENLTGTHPNPWLHPIVKSLILGELWTSCLNHVQARERRLRDRMVATGLTDLFAAHEAARQASLRVATSEEERQTIQEWFGEIASYAWWPGEEVPTVIRRCLATTAGDCRRIGPTEITTLSAQMDERGRIAEDWVRRLFIGLWNALPVVGLIFIFELVILCVIRRAAPDQWILTAPAITE